MRYWITLMVCAATLSLQAAMRLDYNGDRKISVGWLVPSAGAFYDTNNAAKHFQQMLSVDAERAEVVVFTNRFENVLTWAYADGAAAQRKRLFAPDAFDAVIISENPDRVGPGAFYLFEGLLALKHLQASNARALISTYAQKPAYETNHLLDDHALFQQCVVVKGLNCEIAPIALSWKQVVEDKTFEALTPSADLENYVFAGALYATVSAGMSAPPYEHPGLLEKQTARLARSIIIGYNQLPTYLAGVEQMQQSNESASTLKASTFSIALAQGAFEQQLATNLLALAQVDRRTVTFNFTPDNAPPAEATCQLVHQGLEVKPTRSIPLFTYDPRVSQDPTGRKDLAQLDATLARAMPTDILLPLAKARLTKVNPKLIQNTPTGLAPETSAMFAAMVYYTLTGAFVYPENCDAVTRQAIDTGLELLLQQQTRQEKVNAILAEPIADAQGSITGFRYRLWRAPEAETKIHIATTAPRVYQLSPRTMTFTADNFDSWQTLTLTRKPKAPSGVTGSLIWATRQANFHGLSHGTRDL